MLKEEYGMTHGSANRISLIAREADALSIVKAAEESGIDPVIAMYDGAKANLKPIYDKLMEAIQGVWH